MEFFSEIYGCYYRIVAEILARSKMDTISRQEIMDITERFGFAESLLTVPNKLLSGQWSFLEKVAENEYTSRLGHCPQIPLTLLQKRWIKSLVYDRRISLFLTDDALSELSEALSDVEPLWSEDQFYYYDRYENGDDFSSPEYRQSFRQIMVSIRLGKMIRFDYTSAKGKFSQKDCLPLRLEYSPKNDRFRLLALRCPFTRRFLIDRYRLDGMKNVTCLEAGPDLRINASDLKDTASRSLDILMRQSYDAEPVRMLIQNRRNALERAMLHFANYDKDTRQLDENTWECCIYYDSSMETELLIEILSFGPVVKVVGPDSFVELIRDRLRKQRTLLAPMTYKSPDEIRPLKSFLFRQPELLLSQSDAFHQKSHVSCQDTHSL